MSRFVEARVLEMLAAAIDDHGAICPHLLLSVKLSPADFEALDWPELKMVPLRAAAQIPNGHFTLACSSDHCPHGPTRKQEPAPLVTA